MFYRICMYEYVVNALNFTVYFLFVLFGINGASEKLPPKCKRQFVDGG